MTRNLALELLSTSITMPEVYVADPGPPIFIRRFRDLWCRLFHRRVMLPFHGYYQCRRCFRRYPVTLDTERPGDR